LAYFLGRGWIEPPKPTIQPFPTFWRFIGLSEGHWNGDSLESGCHYKTLKPKKVNGCVAPFERERID
jgi:hypothetical protein